MGFLLLPELVQVATLNELLPQLLQRVGLSLEIRGGGPIGSSLNRRSFGPAAVGQSITGPGWRAANSSIQVLLMALALLQCLDPQHHINLLIAATPRFYRPQSRRLLQQCRDALGGWLAGMTISAVSSFCSPGGLARLQVPLALLSGLVCGLLTFVPTIGPTVATLLPTALALVVSPELSLKVIVLRLILQTVRRFC